MPLHYNKLIRDNIPDIHKKNGEKVLTRRTETDQEYWHHLMQKLQEEIDEFGKRQTMEELADVLEVIDAVCDAKKFDKKMLRALKENRAIDLGTFSKRLVLEQADTDLENSIEETL